MTTQHAQAAAVGAQAQDRAYDVVILGGGFAAISTAQSLARDRDLAVALIADQNVMLFHPMLAEVCGASLSPLHVVNPIRNLCPRADVFRATVEDVDFTRRTVFVRSHPGARAERFTYEHLVLALGGVVDLSRVPGMAEHAYPMKTVGDAIRLRSTVIDRLEDAHLISDPTGRARLLHFVVVGGGYSGVETAGQLADLLHGARTLFPWLKEQPATVTLIHAGPYLLPQIGEELGRFAETNLRARGVQILLNTRVSAVTAEKLYLGDRTLHALTVVSTVGNAPHPLVLDLGARARLPLEQGRIVVQPDLRVRGFKNLWAAGDGISLKLTDGTHAVATAQFAQREGALVGANIRARYAGQALGTFTFRSLGELAAIGHHNAVAKIAGFKFSGFFAWLVWRTVYLAKLPGVERKLRVVMDWTLDLLFARDLSLLRTDATPRLGRMHLEPGDVVYSKGDPAQNFYILKSGTVSIRDGGNVIKTVTAGHHFGATELLDCLPRAVDAVATERCELVVMPGETFSTLASTSSEVDGHLRASAVQFIPGGALDTLLDRLPPARLAATVESCMRPAEAIVPADATVETVLRILHRHADGALPIVDASGRVTGVLSRERFLDLLPSAATTPETRLAPSGGAEEWMIGPEETIAYALEEMVRTGARFFAVTDEHQHLLGVLNLTDAILATGADSPDATHITAAPSADSRNEATLRV